MNARQWRLTDDCHNANVAKKNGPYPLAFGGQPDIIVRCWRIASGFCRDSSSAECPRCGELW